jgi:hypothetical protein
MAEALCQVMWGWKSDFSGNTHINVGIVRQCLWAVLVAAKLAPPK